MSGESKGAQTLAVTMVRKFGDEKSCMGTGHHRPCGGHAGVFRCRSDHPHPAGLLAGKAHQTLCAVLPVCRSLFSESYPPMKRDCCTGISPCAAVPFLVLAGHGAQWRDLNWLFCISCTIIKNCEVYTRYHWERRITP